MLVNIQIQREIGIEIVAPGEAHLLLPAELDACLHASFL